MSKFWSPFVKDLVPYVPGEQPKLAKLVKLNTNENPYGPSPKAIAAMQAEQGFPFTDFAGQPIRRYTFRITNYPGMDGGVQANLYLCGDTLIGGDVVATGKGGFQHGLTYPAV